MKFTNTTKHLYSIHGLAAPRQMAGRGVDLKNVEHDGVHEVSDEDLGVMPNPDKGIKGKAGLGRDLGLLVRAGLFECDDLERFVALGFVPDEV